MSNVTATTKEKPLIITSRVDEDGVPKLLRFANEDGSPYDITSEDFEYLLKAKPGTDANIFRLSIGDGLTVQGADNDELLFTVSAANASIRPMLYFGLLRSVANDHTWFNVKHNFIDGYFDGVDEIDEDITIIQSGGDVLVTITQEGISQAELDAAISAATTLTISTQTSTATLTPNGLFDAYELTAQAEALTIANPSTDYANFDGFMVRITGTAQALTFGSKYVAMGEAFPATTTTGTMIITAIRKSDTDEYNTRVTEEV